MSDGQRRAVTERRGEPSARRRLGLAGIGLRQLRSRAALTLAQGLTLAAAVTLVASVVLIQDATTDNGLRSALRQPADPQGSDLVIERDGIATAPAFDAFQRDATSRVRAQLGGAVVAGAQIGKSSAQVLRSIDGVAQGQPSSNLSSVAFYAGLRDHVRLVSGIWPGDTRAGSDWSLTASARATDTLGTPLGLHVGSEYCFSPPSNRGSGNPAWCGRLSATWLPIDASDPYWAGHVPETDVLTGHDSFFQIAALLRQPSDSAIQQYGSDPARVSGANADSVVRAVGQLRGYYSVSSNDVFVSGLDTAITTFLARQSAAAGPMLVTALGILVVAVAAMAFAAVQFLDGHAPQAALWRARGWPRTRLWILHTGEFTALAIAATPVAILASATISSVATGGAPSRPLLTAQSLQAAALPAVAAAAAFVVVLAALTAARNRPELAGRSVDRVDVQRSGWRRRAADIVLIVGGAGILLLVRTAGTDTAAQGQNNGLLLALPVLAVGMLATASLRIVAAAARILSITRTLAPRLARWQLQRAPAQYARLCLLVTLAVTVGVFASTYAASDRASAIDRADYMVGADMRATFSSAASPPQLTTLVSTLPAGARAAQVFRGVGRPGRTGTDATLLGIQGGGFWDIAYSRSDFATPSLPALTATMNGADPDGRPVPTTATALLLTVHSSGFAARVDVEVTDAAGNDRLLPMGRLSSPGWTDLRAALRDAGRALAAPLRVRALQVTPAGSNGTGVVAVENLRTDSGAVIESFARSDGWWQEAFAPDPGEAALKPSLQYTRQGEESAPVAVSLQAVRILPPPSSRPLPVLLAASTMAALGVSVGQPFPLHTDTVDVQLVPVGSFDDFPTHYPQREDLVVAPLVSLLGRLGNQGATSPWSNELWLSLPGNTVAAAGARVSADPTLLSSALRGDAEAAALGDPLRTGIDDELGLGFVVALAVVVVGFALHFLAAARNRATQLAVLRANGVPQATLRRSLVAEQAVVLCSGLVAGTVIGLVLTWAVVPIFHLGALPEDLTPASLFHLDPLTLLAVVGGTGVLGLVVGWLVAGSSSRVDVMATVRSLA